MDLYFDIWVAINFHGAGAVMLMVHHEIDAALFVLLISNPQMRSLISKLFQIT